MIKRRFYRQDHGEGDNASSDSSSSDSYIEAQSSPDSDAESQPRPDPEPTSDVEPDNDDGDGDDDDDDERHASLRLQLPSSSSSSGYESEDSSANEIEAESAGLPTNDDDIDSGKDEEKIDSGKGQPIADDIPSCILRSKSVFKCRLCPKIVCLNMETLRAHLQSKRHSRSEKLLNDGRLKRILNSDGEEEVLSDEDGETHAERHARIVALAQTVKSSLTPHGKVVPELHGKIMGPALNISPSCKSNLKKKGRGRQRQRERLKRKKEKSSSDIPNSGQKKENRAKRRRKNE